MCFTLLSIDHLASVPYQDAFLLTNNPNWNSHTSTPTWVIVVAVVAEVRFLAIIMLVL